MSSSAPTVEPTHVPAPVIRANRPYCPRCDAVLQFNRDEYMCFTCGYEYLLEDREIDLLREGVNYSDARRRSGCSRLPPES
jgi:ribosomal protein S27AE